MRKPLLAIVGATALLAACNDRNDEAEDAIEHQAEASAAAAGGAVAALGLTEAQLLEADLRGANGVELGDVARIERGADGKVDRLLVEVEDSSPDRFVHVPVAGLTTMQRGNETDLSTAMTREQLMALPEVKLPTP